MRSPARKTEQLAVPPINIIKNGTEPILKLSFQSKTTLNHLATFHSQFQELKSFFLFS